MVHVTARVGRDYGAGYGSFRVYSFR